ncbi:MAG: PAS domain-containing sensor histidine kinase [Acidobacteriota bacterium]|nr:PAS domain-containing sensor histidine kinase [Acidobacteriota bacterium]
MNFPVDSKTLSIFHNIFAFFGTLNPDGIVTSIDGKMLNKLKSRREILIGQKFLDVVYWQSSKYNLEKLETAIAEAAVKNVKSTFDLGLSDKEKIFIELFLQPVFGKENIPEYIFFGAQDISNRKNGNKRKITDDKFADSMSADIYQREKKARSEAEEANRSKDFFIAVVSHELRSPLNTILGWTKILLTREIDEAIRKNALETIEKSARSQAKLIDDLVDSARISSSKLQLEFRRINLFEVLKAVYKSQKPVVEAKNVSLEFTSDNENIQISGDAARLQQMFTNLISNALKSTKAGENIKIGVETGENEVKVFVTDDGQGIKPNTLPGVFRQFQQDGEKLSLNRAGLGLELSLVKILVEKHDGKVYAESEGVGWGSTFAVVLPLPKEDRKITSASETGE